MMTLTAEQADDLRGRILRHYRAPAGAIPATFIGGPLEPLNLHLRDEPVGSAWGWTLPTPAGIVATLYRHEGGGRWRLDSIRHPHTRS